MLLRTGTLGLARYAVTARGGGVSRPPYDGLNLGDHVGDDAAAVQENRRRLLGALPGARRLAFMRQVHGASVADADAQPTGTPEADGLLTATPGLAAVVLSADCVPVLLAGRDRPVVAVAHAGREGVAAGVVPALVSALAARGFAGSDLVGYVGPAVCGRCYAVPAGLRERVASVVPEAYSSTAGGAPALDLPAAVAAQLLEAGVADVARSHECTLETADLYSHRRDAVTGRFASVAWLPDVHPAAPSAADTP